MVALEVEERWVEIGGPNCCFLLGGPWSRWTLMLATFHPASKTGISYYSRYQEDWGLVYGVSKVTESYWLFLNRNTSNWDWRYHPTCRAPCVWPYPCKSHFLASFCSHIGPIHATRRASTSVILSTGPTKHFIKLMNCSAAHLWRRVFTGKWGPARLVILTVFCWEVPLMELHDR